MKKIIITGATGLVGMNLLALLHENNLANAKPANADKKSKPLSPKYDIIAIDKNKINLRLGKKLFPEVHFEAADLAQPGTWEELFKNADTVIQLQAQISSPSPEPYARNN
ncbi:MAG: NAD-dependent epimerase/dehydratase family protein, partial [Nanoarchaeota archaeon]